MHENTFENVVCEMAAIFLGLNVSIISIQFALASLKQSIFWSILRAYNPQHLLYFIRKIPQNESIPNILIENDHMWRPQISNTALNVQIANYKHIGLDRIYWKPIILSQIEYLFFFFFWGGAGYYNVNTVFSVRYARYFCASGCCC